MTFAHDTDIDRRLGERLRAARQRHGLTLDDLSQRSGVSRAMISRVERGESSPTAALLVRLGSGLGLTLSALLEESAGGGPLARRAGQAVWRDPASGYVRRNVSPAGTGSGFEIVEVELPAGAEVELVGAAGAPLDQQIWLLEGALDIALGETIHTLRAGDCLQMHLRGAITYRNRATEPARYAVILAASRGLFPGDLAMTTADIAMLDAPSARAALPGLTDILRDCVAGGASVGFMNWNTHAELERYWIGVAAEVEAGRTLLFVAREGETILGTAQLQLVGKPNQPHRAEIAKVLVHSRARRKGLGEALMRAAEAAAKQAKRDLLVLDTDENGAARRLYNRLGWTEAGTIPRYALMPDGADCGSTFFYKSLR